MSATPDSSAGESSAALPGLTEVQLAGIIALATDAVITTDGAQRITSFNEAAESIFGYEAAELLGQPLDVLIPVHARAQHRRHMAAFGASRTGVRRMGERTEITGLRKNGEVFPAEASVLKLETDAGPVFAVSLRDLSERVRGLEALRRSEQQFRLMVEGVRNYAIFMLDPGGHVVSWNAGAEAIKGYRAEEVLGRHFSIFYPAEQVARGWPEHVLAQAAREGRFEEEAWRVRKDGTRFWASVTLTALRGADGALIGYGKVTRDLTERQRMEQQARELIREQAGRAAAEAAAGRLRESEERFRTMADTAPVLIWTSGADGRYDWFNQPWLEFTGRALVQELGEGWLWGVHGEDVEHRRGAYQAAFERREPFRVEYRLRRADGQYRWLIDHGVPRFTPGGDFAGFIGSCIDRHEEIEQRRMLAASTAHLEELTTELSNMVDELQARTAEADAARQQAEEASRAKSQFLAVMSHELRTPLNVVLGFVDLLAAELAGPLTDLQRDHLARIQASSWHLLDLINRVLSFSRIEAGKEELHLERTDMAALVRESAQLIGPAASKKGLELRVEVPSAPVATRTDVGKVRQILLNLLNNAVKYTDAGTVELRLALRNGWIDIEVSDTGIGIPDEQTGRIFEPFTQVEQSSSRGRGGTGLGLSVTRELVQLLHGRIELESEPGRGSRFRVRLPA